MNLSKINNKNLGVSATQAGLGIVGAAGSGALVAIVPEKNQRVAKIGMLIAGVALTAASVAAKNPNGAAFSVGVAVRQGFELASDLLKDKVQITDNSSMGQKAIAGALGLNCPGGCQGSYDTSMRYPALNSPTAYDTVYEEEFDYDDGLVPV